MLSRRVFLRDFAVLKNYPPVFYPICRARWGELFKNWKKYDSKNPKIAENRRFSRFSPARKKGVIFSTIFPHEVKKWCEKTIK